MKPACFSSLVAAILLAVSCSANHRNGGEMPSPVADYTESAGRWVDSVMGTMTLEERVGQIFMPALYASSDPSTIAALRHYVADLHIGGIVLLKGDMRSVVAIADTLRSMVSPGLWISIDAEWGLGMRLSDAPVFPKNRSLGESDEQLIYDYGYEMARECRALGINMILGPVMDVASDGASIMRNRSFGSDPQRVASLALAYSRGVEDGAVISVAKHFPGHGSTSADSHRLMPVIDRNLAQLDSVDLLPFREYVSNGLSAVMVGHLSVPAVESGNVSASLSREVITGLLKGKLGFKGLVLTDAMNMKGAAGASAVAALKAGADMIVAPSDTNEEVDAVLKAVGSGEISVGEINARCRKILFYKYKADVPGGRLSSHSGELKDSVCSVQTMNLLRKLKRI